MSRLVAIAVGVGLLLLTAQQASAQGTSGNVPNFGPYWRQPLSPYLNLGRGGSPAINYFLGTLPEQDRRANAFLFSNELQDLENRNLATLRSENLAQPITAEGPNGLTGARPISGNTGSYYADTAGYFGNNGPRFGVVQQPQVGQPQRKR